MANLITFRDTLNRVLPWWLNTGLGGKIIYAIGSTFDALADAAVASVNIRFPDATQEDALALMGRDRKIRRGSLEPSDVYATRLQPWLDDHRTRGNPYALLAQLHAYFAQAPFLIELIYQSGRRFSMDLDGNVTRDDVNLGDLNIEKWARWTLIYHWPTTLNTFGKWGSSGKKWGENGNLWGVDPSSLSAAQARDLVLIPTEWNAAHCRGTIVLLGPGRRVWGYPPRKWGSSSDKWGAGGKSVRLPIGI